MKTLNFKKLTVSALAIAMGAGLAGAISGTFAWYQYSTRSTVAMVGTSIGTSGSLQVKVTKGSDVIGFKDNIETSELSGNAAPVTTGKMASNAAIPMMKKNPHYMNFEYANWSNAVANTDYIQFKVDFQVSKNVNGTVSTTTPTAVFLENVTIQQHYVEDTNNPNDISGAVRVHLSSGSSNVLLAKEAVETETGGVLDLNNDGKNDTAGARYEWDTFSGTRYGDAADEKQVALAQDDSSAIATLTNDAFSGGFAITPASGVTVTIWLEGWHPLDENLSNSATDDVGAIWDTGWMGEKFDVGLAFAVNEL